MAKKSASNVDAGDILADILDETEADARAERERLESLKREKEEAERQKKLAQEASLAQEAEKRLQEEQQRLEALAKRRHDRLSPEEIEMLKAAGKYVDPRADEKAAAEEAARRKAEEERIKNEMLEKAAAEKAELQQKMATQAAQAAQILEAEQKSKKRITIAVSVFLFLLIGGGATAAFLLSQQYQPDNTVYSKSHFTPQDIALTRVDVSSTLIPDPIIKEEEKEAPTRRRRRRSNSKSNSGSRFGRKTKSNSASKKAAEFDKMLGGSSDIFGSGL